MPMIWKPAPINLLHLEDQPEDVLLCQRALEAADLHVKATRVESRLEFTEALSNDNFDLILSDYTLPAFDGLSALEIARDLRPEVPFLFYSGTLGEEAAVEALHQGAVDYVLKTRPLRLPTAVRRALREAEEHRHRVQSEQAMRASEQLAHRHLAELQLIYREAPVALGYLDKDLYFIMLNEKFAEIGGKPVKDYIGHPVREMLPEIGEKLDHSCRRVLQTGKPMEGIDICSPCASKTSLLRRWCANINPLKNCAGIILGLNLALLEMSRRLAW